MYTATGLKRTFVHELEHMMGLDDYDVEPACLISDAAMQKQFNCAGTVSLPTLTINDFLPVKNSVYGPGSKTTCGW